MAKRIFLLALTSALMAATAQAQPASDDPAGAPIAAGPPPLAAEPEAAPETAPPPSPPPDIEPAPVAVQPLSVLDLFSVGGPTPGLGPDLWQGSSADLARAILPQIGVKPLPGPFADLAVAMLSTPATGPGDGGSDPSLAAARAMALVRLGHADVAASILARTNGVAASEPLSQAAAEAFLLAGDDDKACATAQALTNGRDSVYWLRLRAYCQAKEGNVTAAQLTADLAEAQEKDAVFRRYMSVMIAGAGSPGARSERNGLDHAMAHRLGLELAPVTPPAPPSLPTPSPAVATALAAALGGDLSPKARAELASLDIGKTEAPAARRLAMRLAAAVHAKADVVLLALLTAGDGMQDADRVEIVEALAEVGLSDAARAIAGDLKPPS